MWELTYTDTPKPHLLYTEKAIITVAPLARLLNVYPKTHWSEVTDPINHEVPNSRQLPVKGRHSAQPSRGTLMNFHKARCQVLHVSWSDPKH